MTRGQPLLLEATVTLPSCVATATDSKVTYVWSVYKDLAYQSDLVSTALNPKTFALPAYSLLSSNIYTVVLTATQPPDHNSSYTDYVGVTVAPAGVVVAVSGGRRAVSATTVVIDAGSTSDLDDPLCGAACLQLTWVCSQISPDFGSPCDLAVLTPSAATLVVDLSAIHQPMSLQFTVFGTSSLSGQSASASIVIDVVPAVVMPSVSLASTLSKYNPGDRIVLSGTVDGDSPVTVAWSADGVDLSTKALSPLLTTLGAGKSVVSVAFAPNLFTVGQSYTLTLSAVYSGGLLSSAAASSSVVVRLNSAPSQGTVAVDPSSGAALNTSFFVCTQHWTDDAGSVMVPHWCTCHL
jgi:hypothetical protein